MYNKEEALKKSIEYFENDSLAADVFLQKYALHDAENNLLEQIPTDMFKRISKEIARVEKKKFKNPMTEEEIFSYIDNYKDIVPQGSPLAGIGNFYSYQTLGNCYVLENVVDSYGGIFYSDQQLGQFMKRRAGVGMDISNLRPKGMFVKNSARTTDGIAIFMERFSNTCREVAQKGRRGALLLSMNVHHPEIETFINIKKDLKKVTGANISVKLTDEFMKAVENDSEYEQYWPMNSDKKQISIKVKARTIWNQIIDCAWSTGEPGVMFWDTMIDNSMSNRYGKINQLFYDQTTNPCFAGSEYMLTNNGYVKFIDAYNSKNKNTILADNRISYVNDGVEKVENWKIDKNQTGVCQREASEVFLTKENASLVNVVTEFGVEIKCTPDHHFATYDGMVEAKDLVGKDILISMPECQYSIVDTEPETDDEISALLMGLITGDGNIAKWQLHLDFWGDDALRMVILCKKYIDHLYNKNYGDIDSKLVNGWDKRILSPYYVSFNEKESKYRISSTWLKHYFEIKYGFTKETKLVVPKFIMENSRNKSGLFYVAGLYYADGTVNIATTCVTVRLNQSNKDLLKSVQLILHSNGILSKIYMRRKSEMRMFKGKEYMCKDNYELISINGSHVLFSKNIGFFDHPNKDKKIKDYISTYNTYKHINSNVTKVLSVEFLDVKENVYCIKEDIGRNIIVNGCSVRRCGEIIMGVDSCRLMIVPLHGFVKEPFTKEASFDFDRFGFIVEKAQRFMEDMIDLELECIDRIIEKIKSDPEDIKIKQIELDTWINIRYTCENGRRTGLGVNALADTLASLNIKYGSDESLKMVDKIFEKFAVHSLKSSCEMAKELGAFPIYNKELEYENINPLLEKIFKASPEVRALHEKYGRRNISLTTCSPTGTVSIQTRTSSGIEPLFTLNPYTRRKKINPDNTTDTIDFIDEMGDKWHEYKVYHPYLQKWMAITGKTDVKESPYYGATSDNISWEQSVKMQGIAQSWISHSISKTVNAPNNTTKDVVDNVYICAWKEGCKGITFYRDGSRSGVLVTDVDKKDIPFERLSPKRPKDLSCDIYHLNVSKKLDRVRTFKYTVIVGVLNDSPYEIFALESEIDKKIKEGKLIKHTKGCYELKDNDNNILIDNITIGTSESEDSLTRMISTSLRHSVPIQFIVEQLNKVEGEMFCFAKAISRALKKYIKNGTKSTDICPECGNKLMFVDGCKSCSDCGWSKCG